MKNYKLLFSGVVCGAVMLFNLAASADNDKAGVVTVVRLQGRAQYSIDGGQTWIPAVVGKALSAGSLIRSDDKSIVDILVGKTYAEKTAEFMQFNPRVAPANNFVPKDEHNIIRLRPNTTLGIDKLTVSDSDSTYVSDAELNLKKGRIFASVRKVSPSSVYLVKIPDGVAAVRGTQLELDTDGTSSSCAVSSGTVWLSFSITDANGNPVTGPDGNPFPPVQVTLTPGQSFNLNQGLLNQLSQQLNTSAANSGITPTTTITQVQLQTLINAIVNAATSTVTTLDAVQLQQLAFLANSPLTINIIPGTIAPTSPDLVGSGQNGPTPPVQTSP